MLIFTERQPPTWPRNPVQRFSECKGIVEQPVAVGQMPCLQPQRGPRFKRSTMSLSSAINSL